MPEVHSLVLPLTAPAQGPSLHSVAGVLVILGQSEFHLSHYKMKILSLKKLLIKKVTDHVHKMPGTWEALSMLVLLPISPLLPFFGPSA